MADQKPEIKVYTQRELCNIYGVTEETFKKWLLKITNLEPRTGNFYTPKQVEIIFNHLGTPGV